MGWANPQAFPDEKVSALACCFWAETHPPYFDGRCAPQCARSSEPEIAAARQQAMGL